MKYCKRRLGVGNDAERRPQDTGDLGRIYVNADQFEVGVDTPAYLRLVQAGAYRQHDIRFAPEFMAGKRRLGQVMAVADDALATGIADHWCLQHLGDREHLFGSRNGAAADKEQGFLESASNAAAFSISSGSGIVIAGDSPGAGSATSVSSAMTSSGISSATGRGRPSRSWRNASLTSCPVWVGWLIRAAHLVKVRNTPSWSGISCSRPKPRPIKSEGIW